MRAGRVVPRQRFRPAPDTDSQVLVIERPVVVVWLEPVRAYYVQASAQQIASIVGVDGAAAQHGRVQALVRAGEQLERALAAVAPTARPRVST